jgi:hypothetical protein
MHTLQSSLDRLNETMIVNNARLDQMNALITGLVADSAVQATEIAAMRDDVGNLQLAVERHGIDIKASFGKLGLDALDWQSLRDDLEIPKGTSVLWKMTPIYDPEK